MPEETKVKKKRGWVKNAIIIFLAVMLVLTFFSNTIMNRSLPEVAVQMVDQNTINTQVRGSGTINAVQNYEVSVQDTRTVQTVNVQEGQEVKTGDLLFTLSAADTTQLDEAQKTLEQLQLDYQKALINASDADYAAQNREIQRLREDLKKAQGERDAIYPSYTDYTKALELITTCQQKLENYKSLEVQAQREVDRAQENLNAAGGGEADTSALDAARQQLQEADMALQEAQQALSQAQDNLSSIKLNQGYLYDELVYETKEWIGRDYNNEYGTDDVPDPWSGLTEQQRQQEIDRKLPIYLPAKAQQYQDDDPKRIAYEAIVEAEGQVSAAQKTANDAQRARTNAQNAYNKALNDYQQSINDSTAYEALKKALREAQDRLSAIQASITETQNSLDTEKANTESYKTASDSVDTIEQSIEDKIFELQQQQKEDNKTEKIEALDLQAMRGQIADQQELIAKLGGGNGSSNEILAPVSGVVRSVSITAGNQTVSGEAMAVIEVPDLGYQVEFSVTSEQASKLTIGDEAQISNSYWWSSGEMTAKLLNIKTDPQSPQQNKILVFSLEGEDIAAGSQIALSIGARSVNYDTVVPNSAIRQDTNGTFVYMLVARQSPLGNRYVAQRVDVTVSATDDINSAVSGGLATGDYVITTSTAPVEPGMYVRMAES